jgi:hypothetical protein
VLLLASALTAGGSRCGNHECTGLCMRLGRGGKSGWGSVGVCMCAWYCFSAADKRSQLEFEVAAVLAK